MLNRLKESVRSRLRKWLAVPDASNPPIMRIVVGCQIQRADTGKTVALAEYELTAPIPSGEPSTSECNVETIRVTSDPELGWVFAPFVSAHFGVTPERLGGAIQLPFPKDEDGGTSIDWVTP